jgi:plastocyanin domain-containing protein
MNKTVSIIVTLGLIIALGIIFLGDSKPKDNNTTEETMSNIEIKNGVQYITVKAGGGYAPNVSFAKAGIPTKLIMKTNGIYDCSASLVIRSINFQKILPQTGETEIDLGIPKAGEPLRGVCGMGMYSFEIDFQ